MSNDDDLGGIDIERAHPRAVELIPDEFFWSCVDELGPFGSDEGDTALNEFREWRQEHPKEPLEACLVWTIESVGEIDVADYDDAIFDEATVKAQVEDPDFDDQQLIYTVDTSVIATAFGQLVDEGTIDASAKPYVSRALKRQLVWANVQDSWGHAGEYSGNLARLQSVLEAV